jgi:hypothetical protein
MDIQHDRRQGKFFTMMYGEEYSLEYNEVDKNLWEFHCPVLRYDDQEAKAINDSLIEYGLFYLKRNNIKLLENGSCMQVREFLDNKKELEGILQH